MSSRWGWPEQHGPITHPHLFSSPLILLASANTSLSTLPSVDSVAQENKDTFGTTGLGWLQSLSEETDTFVLPSTELPVFLAPASMSCKVRSAIRRHLFWSTSVDFSHPTLSCKTHKHNNIINLKHSYKQHCNTIFIIHKTNQPNNA